MKQFFMKCLKQVHGTLTQQRYVSKFQIEVTGNCNLSCSYCFRTTNEYAAKGIDMDIGLYRRIIDEAKPYRVYPGKTLKASLLLQGFGEPTLHPRLEEMIRYASDSEKFADVRVISNLTVLAPSDYDSLFEAGLSKMGVSIDTLDKANLSNTRRGSNLDRLVSALEHICKTYPERLQVLTVLSNSNYDSFDEFKRQLIGMGLQSIEVQRLITYTKSFGITDEQWQTFMARYGGDGFVQFSQPVETQKPSCTRPFNNIYIDSQGYVLPCCIIPMREKLHFGNVQDDGLYSRYLCPEFEHFREEFLKKRPAHCRGCVFY